MGGREFSRSGHWRAFWRSGHWRALWRMLSGSGHWRALWRTLSGSGHWRALWSGGAELAGTSGDEGERRGGSSISSSALQSIKSPSMSSRPRCTISSPSATVQGAELHSALTPSTAGFLVVGIVAGSHTWSDGLGSTSVAIIRSVARLRAGSQIAAGNGSPSSVGSG